MELFRLYRCRIKLRPQYRGRALKRGVSALDNKIFDLKCMWQCEENENYPNEYALIPQKLKDQKMFSDSNLFWIASGDVEILNK